MKANKRKGFTLIELLVVIAIISLLASIILASVYRVRIKARDTKRVADMHQVQNALELYHSTNGHYPYSNGTWASFDAPVYIGNGIISPNAANLAAALQPFLSQGPIDPKSLGTDSGYLYFGDTTGYCFMIYKTPENMKNFSSNLVSPRCGTIDAAGNCGGIDGSVNAIYVGVGGFAAGC